MRRLQQWLRVNRERITKWREAVKPLVNHAPSPSSPLLHTHTHSMQQLYHQLFEQQHDATTLVQGHYMIFVDPDLILAKHTKDGLSMFNELMAMVQLHIQLASNKRLCQVMGRLWRDRPDVAASVDHQMLAALHQSMREEVVDPAIILHSTEFLCKHFDGQYLSPGSQASRQTVSEAVQTYITAVDNTSHLRLDAGHWHELWLRGEDVAMHVVCMYLRHENRERLESNRNMLNAAACINRNIQNLSDVLSTSNNILPILKELWGMYPEFAAGLDLSVLLRMAENDTSSSDAGGKDSGKHRPSYVRHCDKYFTDVLFTMVSFTLPSIYGSGSDASQPGCMTAAYGLA